MKKILYYIISLIFTHISFVLLGWGLIWLCEEPFDWNSLWHFVHPFLRHLFDGDRIDILMKIIIILSILSTYYLTAWGFYVSLFDKDEY